MEGRLSAEIAEPIGYRTLISTNRDFRYLWFGQIVSNLGDWFNLIASASLVALLTDSGLAVGGLFVIRTLAPFLASPVGGVIADRYKRRNILIWTDLLRAVTMFGFLLVRDPEDIWLLYALTAVLLFISGIFYPTRTAMLPDIVPENGIGTATAISGATFSAMLAVGSALGGFVAGTIGIYEAFVINGFTFFLSAYFIAQITERSGAGAGSEKTISSVLREYADGLRYMGRHRYLLAIIPNKAFVGLLLGSTFEVVQVAIAEQVYPIGEGGSMSLGFMFSFTGVGLALGPVLLRPFTKDQLRRSAWAITVGYLVGGLGLALTAPLASYGLTLVGTFLRGAGNGIVWLFSTQLILQLVPTEVRGRVVSTEFALSMLVSAMGAAAVGAALDFSVSISTVAWVMALLTLIPATLWSLYLIVGHERIALPDTA